MTSPGEYNKLQSTSGTAAPFLAKLLLDAPRLPDATALLADLRRALGRVERFGDPAGDGPLGFAYPDRTTEFADVGSVPCAHFVSLMPDATNTDLALALGQTWDWDGAEEAISRTKAIVLFNDLKASGVPRGARFQLFARALQVIARHVAPLAIHYLPSQRLIDPEKFVAESTPDPTNSAINVRLFRVEGRAAGECLMDTLGMAAFGLPDLQCHFVEMDPGRVAATLYGYAEYLFSKGLVIEDGHTVQGITPGSQWRCRYEQSLMDPPRGVIDIDPGPGLNAR